MSFVSRLPPRSRQRLLGDQVVRRVEFTVEPHQAATPTAAPPDPLLQTNVFGDDEHTIVLARDMTRS